MPTTNFPNGATNNTAQNALGQMISQDPSKAHTYFNDFDTYLASEWIVTEVGANGQSLINKDGGVLRLTNANEPTTSTFLQKLGESFLMEAGKPAFFKARFNLSDVVDSECVIGLQVVDTTPLSVTDGIYFIKNDASALLDFVVVKDSVSTTASGIATLVNDVDITVSFYYDGVDKIDYYAGTDSKNPTWLGRSVTTNLPDDEELTVSFGFADANALRLMDIDYIFASKER